MSGWIWRIYNSSINNAISYSPDYAVAINFITYRNATMKYIYYNKDVINIVIPQAMLSEYLPVPWSMHARHTWNARISNGIVYVWGNATPRQIFLVRKLLRQSLAVGEAQGGILQPAGEALPAFVPEGSLVSATGSNRYRPDNEHY